MEHFQHGTLSFVGASHFIIAVMALTLQGCAAHTLMTKERSYPKLQGVDEVEGTDAQITIRRDQYGVPHIRAETERDLWFAIGYVHAQDRLFQIDLIRHLSSGRLSEWFGAETVDFDAFIQSIDYKERAKSRLSSADPKLLEAGKAYADGINAGAANLPELPIEYRMLDLEFEEWRMNDSMSSTVLNSWILSENAPNELISLMLRDQLDSTALDALWRWDRTSPEIDAYWDDLRKVDIGNLNASFNGLIEFLWGVQVPSASNNWAVGGSRTQSGKPILANDPHLLQRVPSVWYVLEGSGGDVHIAGASLAGNPFMASGHNEHIAWGVTNTMTDYIDLAVLERDGESGYILAGERYELRPVEKTIYVKDEEPQTRVTYWTQIGPVITELTGTHIVALRWHLWEIEDQTADIFFNLQSAQSTKEALDIAKQHSMLSQNLVVADVDGNIGWQTFGSAPQRRGYTGRLPYPASDPQYGWDGWIFPLPGDYNPQRDYIQTANSKPDHERADEISTAFLPSWRHDRIGALIEEKNNHTIESMNQIQLDVVDQHAVHSLRAIFADINVEKSECGRILADWDGLSGQRDIGPAVWAVFQDALMTQVLRDDLGDKNFRLYQAAVVSGRTVLDAKWRHFSDNPEADVLEALEKTCDVLKADLGKDSSQWQWGELHTLRIRHPFSEETSLLESWSLPTVPYWGSHHTVNQSGYSWYNDTLEATWIASIRIVTPMDDPSKGTFIYPGGQSGHPGHPDSQSLFNPYLAGQQLPLFFSDSDVETHAQRTLILKKSE